ncbi:DUF4870 domain-containing protein [Gallaecimonas sp. GXIMD4217]|uniref:DUF4870 domain-containing protein n=1 Tax=Gallaecimonas sp. GXIMD4217 TaxID=3131927 RepID=UPI00311B13CC
MNEIDQMDNETRNWALACHAASFAGLIVPLFGSVLGPLIVWLMKREQHPYIDEQGKEALNFQITMIIAYAMAAVLVVILIGILLLWALVIFDLIMVIMAMVKTANGEDFRYPISLRLVK